MVDWITITDEQVDPNAPLTSELMTALRDNPSALAERAAGSPVILGSPYNYQEFLTSGTWTKPANAASGDVVLVHVVGGGGAGGRDDNGGGTGGGGGGGAFQRFDEIDDLGATETVVVGAGAAGRSTDGNGANGGASSFGTENTEQYLIAGGGGGGLRLAQVNPTDPTEGGRGGSVLRYQNDGSRAETNGGGNPSGQEGGDGGRWRDGNITVGASSITGGGGGGGAYQSEDSGGGPSMMAGGGGRGSDTSVATDGMFPGGGGGGTEDGTSGSGADGVVRVWCVRES